LHIPANGIAAADAIQAILPSCHRGFLKDETLRKDEMRVPDTFQLGAVSALFDFERVDFSIACVFSAGPNIPTPPASTILSP
jgi:hypothetical protein